MKSLRFPIGFLLVFTLGVVGWANSAAAKPAAIPAVAVVGLSLGAEDFLPPMACKPVNACATVSPASGPATRPILPPKAIAVD